MAPCCDKHKFLCVFRADLTFPTCWDYVPQCVLMEDFISLIRAEDSSLKLKKMCSHQIFIGLVYFGLRESGLSVTSTKHKFHTTSKSVFILTEWDSSELKCLFLKQNKTLINALAPLNIEKKTDIWRWACGCECASERMFIQMYVFIHVLVIYTVSSTVACWGALLVAIQPT